MAHVRLYVRQSPDHDWARAGNCWCPDEAAREAALLVCQLQPSGQIGAKAVGDYWRTPIFVVWPRPPSLPRRPEPRLSA